MQILITILISCVGFALTFLALLLEKNYGKAKTRRCSCQASKALMKEFANRDKAARQAARYSPRQVDLKNLPIIEDR